MLVINEWWQCCKTAHATVIVTYIIIIYTWQSYWYQEITKNNDYDVTQIKESLLIITAFDNLAPASSLNYQPRGYFFTCCKSVIFIAKVIFAR